MPYAYAFLCMRCIFLSEPSVCTAKSLAGISRGNIGQTLKRQAQALLAAPPEVVGLALQQPARHAPNKLRKETAALTL